MQNPGTRVTFSHPKTVEWETPPEVFDPLHREFAFTLDVAATHGNTKCTRHFTIEEDGLAQDWSGDVCWMNPPYGRAIKTWMRKAYEESLRGATVVCLVPARTDTGWWWDYAMKGEIRFVRGRIRFSRSKVNAPFPCAIVVFRGVRDAMDVMAFDLTADQVETVLAEALARSYWELDVDGQMPRDPHDREVAAKELVRQCALSRAVGNPAEGITNILTIAGVDSARVAQPEQTQTETPGGEMATATTADDLTQHSTDLLRKFRETLLNYPDQANAEVQQNIQMLDAEMARRGEPVSGAPAPAAPPAAPPPPQPPAPPSAPAPQPAAQSPERIALEDQITLPMMRAHGLDPSQIPAVTDDQLRSLIATGQQAPPPPVFPVAEPVAAPAPPQPQPTGQTVETTHVVVAPPPPLPPDRPGPAAEVPAPVESEREKLEAQVTGPMLKAFGRGRTEVPSIGDNELRFMVEHPKGDVTQEMLLAERAKDEAASGGTVAADPPTPAPTSAPAEASPAVAPSAPPVASGGPTVMLTPSVTVVDATTPGTDPNYQTLIAQTQAEQQREIAQAPQAPQRVTQKQAIGKTPPPNPAQEVIDAEHFPVPPEIDERPPRLPFDLSVASDDELRSFHARFHACHSRANYVVGLWEGELRDLVKLRKGREVEVANSLPTKDPEDTRKRLTDAQREAMVAADSEVVACREREHEVERVLRQLRTLRDGYSSDVSTCSRQWSFRKGEQDGAGGLR